MQFPIEVGLHRSCFLERGLCLAGALAALSVWLPDWPPVIPVALNIVAAGIFLHAWRHLDPPVQALLLLRNGQLAVRQRADEAFRDVVLDNQAVVHPWLTVVRYLDKESGKGKTALVLLPDSLDATHFRRLRVWLRAHLGAHEDFTVDVL